MIEKKTKFYSDGLEVDAPYYLPARCERPVHRSRLPCREWYGLDHIWRFPGSPSTPTP